MALLVEGKLDQDFLADCDLALAFWVRMCESSVGMEGVASKLPARRVSSPCLSQ